MLGENLSKKTTITVFVYGVNKLPDIVVLAMRFILIPFPARTHPIQLPDTAAFHVSDFCEIMIHPLTRVIPTWPAFKQKYILAFDSITNF